MACPLSMFVITFEVINAVVCHFQFFLKDSLLLFKMIGALNHLIVKVYLLFQLLQTIGEQRGAFPVGEK